MSTGNTGLVFSHYALVHPGYSIVGVGMTVEEAREDAAEWLDETDTQTGEEQAQEADVIGSLLVGTYRQGKLCIVHCTKALYDYVQEYGTCTWADDPDNQGICLPRELEEDE